MPSGFPAVTNKEISQIIKQAVPKYTKKVTKFGLEVLTGHALSQFDLNLSMKPVEKFFVYKCEVLPDYFI